MTATGHSGLNESEWDRVFTLAEAGRDEPPAQYLEALRSSGEPEPILEKLAIQLDLGASSDSPDRHRSGERIGARIELRSHLRDGGAGSVYLGSYAAEDRIFPVAVKLLRNAAGEVAIRDAWQREQQLLKEFSASGRTPALIEAGEHTSTDGASYLYLCTEYKHGLTLRRWCDDHALDAEARIRLFLEVCAAVSTIHAHGLVHGDLKPDNVQVEAAPGGPRVWLVDLGLSRLQGRLWPSQNHLVGTPGYMSPEQVCERYGVVDETSDIYSLGIVLFELLEGRLALDVRGVSTPEDLLERLERRSPLELRAVTLGGRQTKVESAVQRATALRASERFPRISVLRQVLVDALGDARPTEASVATAIPLSLMTSLYAMPRSPSLAFAGRRSELRTLESALESTDASSPSIAIEGLGGIGKTELALQTVNNLARRGAFRGGIFWLESENPDLRPQWARDIAPRWGISEGPPEHRTEHLLRELGRLRLPVLIVLDNVTSWAPEARPGPLPEGTHIRLLVTTRARNLGGAAFEHVLVDALRPPDDRTLLESLAGRLVEPGVQALLKHLAGHPLALEIAGAFLATYRAETARSYLRALRADAAELEAEVTGSIGYQRTVTQSLRTAWDRLGRQERETWKVASAFADAPATEALGSAVGIDPRALRRLEDVHVISRTNSGEWTMHRLCRAFGRSIQNAAELQWTTDAFLNGCLGYSKEIDPLSATLVYSPDRPHFDRAVDLASEHWGPKNKKFIALCHRIGYARAALDDLEGTRALLVPVVSFYEWEVAHFAAVSGLVATAQYRLAGALVALGVQEHSSMRIERALDCFRASLAHRTRERDPVAWANTQSGLGTALVRLAWLQRRADGFDEAIAAFRAALEEHSPSRSPRAFSASQCGLGDALLQAAIFQRSPVLFSEAAQAYRAGLLEDRQDLILDRARIHDQIAEALVTPGLWQGSDSSRLEAAIATLEEIGLDLRSSDALDRVACLSSRGFARLFLALRCRSPEPAVMASHELRQASELAQRERLPKPLTAARGRLAITLHFLGAVQGSVATLRESETILRELLEEAPEATSLRQRILLPMDLGCVLQTAGLLRHDSEQVGEAIEWYERASGVLTRSSHPSFSGALLPLRLLVGTAWWARSWLEDSSAHRAEALKNLRMAMEMSGQWGTISSQVTLSATLTRVEEYHKDAGGGPPSLRLLVYALNDRPLVEICLDSLLARLFWAHARIELGLGRGDHLAAQSEALDLYRESREAWRLAYGEDGAPVFAEVLEDLAEGLA